MCLAVPGKIVKIEENVATLDFDVEKRQAKILGDDYKVGDYVIAQGGIVAIKVPEEQAKESLEAFKNSQL